MQIKLMGPFEAVRANGDRVEFNTRKAQALIGLLALEVRGVSRERIASLFWPDLGEERARHNVRQALSRIRADLGPIFLDDGDTLRLDANACEVDARTLIDNADATDQAALSVCLSMCTGEFLDTYNPRESTVQDWLTTTRVRLRDLSGRACDRLVEQLIAGGQLEEALDYLRRHLDRDPAHEAAHCAVMKILEQQGRRSEALRQYQLLTDALARALDTEPGAEARALYERLRSDGGLAEAASVPALRPEAPDSAKPMVAVLPFEDLSAEPLDYFADGITEDIITALSCFHAIQVIARGSAFVYKGKNTSDQEVAAALGARFLVRGSLRRIGARIRLNVHLLDGVRGVSVWSQRFDREMTDVFEMQDEITSTVVSTLAGRVESSEMERARSMSPDRLEAYDLLLRGKDYHHRFTPEDCATCIEMFGRAIERDPDFAVAHAWLACGLGQAMVWELNDQATLVDQAQSAAERGLALDENESECHRILAQVWLTRGDLQRSLRHQERALSLNPNDDRCVCAMGEILTLAGRPEEGEQWVRQSMRLNPYHPPRYWTHLARAVYHQGKYAEAIDIIEQIGRPRQDDFGYLIAASANVADEAQTQRHINALRIAFPDFDARGFFASMTYAREEDRARVLDPLLEALDRYT